jgi:hypothetical protein
MWKELVENNSLYSDAEWDFASIANRIFALLNREYVHEATGGPIFWSGQSGKLPRLYTNTWPVRGFASEVRTIGLNERYSFADLTHTTDWRPIELDDLASCAKLTDSPTGENPRLCWYDGYFQALQRMPQAWIGRSNLLCPTSCGHMQGMLPFEEIRPLPQSELRVECAK